jgi:hypothetical protein
VCFHRSVFVYLAPFLALSYNSSLYFRSIYFLSLHISIFILFFLLLHSLSYLSGFPSLPPVCCFLRMVLPITVFQSVIILSGKKYAHNLLYCLLKMTPVSSLEIYRRFRGNWLWMVQHLLKLQCNSARLHIFTSWYTFTLMMEKAAMLRYACPHELDSSCYDNIPCSNVDNYLFQTLLVFLGFVVPCIFKY